MKNIATRAFNPAILTVLLFMNVSKIAAQETAQLDWVKRFGSTSNERGRDMVLDEDGNIYITGFYIGTVDFDPGPGVFNLTSEGSSDIFVLKLDPQGNFIWAKSMGGPNGDTGYGIALDNDRNVYITGGFSGTANFDPGPGTFNIIGATTGHHEIFVVKLNNDGDFVWAKGVVGGTWWDNGHKIEVDLAGNVHVIGRFYFQGGPRDFDPGPDTYFLTAGHEDIFILKLNTDGNFVWARNFGTSPHESRGYSIALDNEGNVYATGYFRGIVDFDPGPGTFHLTSVGNWNIFYLKLDANGDFVWAKSMVNSITNYHSVGDHGRKIIVDNNGNLYTTGRFNGTVDFDPGPDVFNMTASGGDFDIYITKLTTDGNFVWARTMGGSAYDEGYTIKQDNAGNIYVAGFFRNTVDFNPGAETFNITSAGLDDGFVTKFDSDGNFIWAISMGGTNNDQAMIVEVNDAGELFVLGWFMGTADADPGPCTNFIVSAGQQDIFLQKFKQALLIPLSINDFSENEGFVGSTITITGTGFSEVPSDNTVVFSDNVIANVISSSANSISVIVPEGAFSGQVSVSVNCITVTSANNFTVIPNPIITITEQPTLFVIVCEGEEVLFTTIAEGTSNISYQWQKFEAGNFSDISDNAVYTNTNTSTLTINSAGGDGAGLYRCRVTGDNAEPVVSSASEFEIIIVNPPQPVTGQGSAAPCGENTVNLQVTGAVGDEYYLWYEVPDGGTPIDDVFGNTYTTPELQENKTYYVAIFSPDGCESSRLAVEAIIPLVPETGITLEGNRFMVQSGAASYQWYQNGEIIPGASDHYLDVFEYGIYFVRITSSNGCTADSDTIEFYVTGDEPYGFANFQVYPNPGREYLQITWPSVSASVKLKLFDLQGRIVKENILTGVGFTGLWNLDGLQSGVYYLWLEIPQAKVVKRIMITK